MTKQESFKRSVRARMAKTGEKYGAARRSLIEAGGSSTNTATADADAGPPAWIEQPETSDEAVREATGRSWDEWCALIDEWPERTEGHTAMAARIGRDHIDDGWWAQCVIVGYERIRGLRTKYMRADGTFAGGVTRTIDGDAENFRALLLDVDRMTASLRTADPDRRWHGELRSRPGTKSIRWGLEPGQGAALFSVESKGPGSVRVSIRHEGLDATESVEYWKGFWANWLASQV